MTRINGHQAVQEHADGSEDRLAATLVAQGHCEPRAMERARQVSSESGQRLDAVLLQLGLLTERVLASAYAQLLGARIATPDRYPPDQPIDAGQLSPRFLRHARALPVAIEDGCMVVAAADPLDAFLPAAIAAATGKRVVLEVAVPIELEAAFARLYPEDGKAGDLAEESRGEALEDDAERLKDMASEAPVIRLVNQIIARAVETPCLRYPCRTVRGPAPGPLPLRRSPAGGGTRRQHG